MISGATKIYGIFGYPVRHTFSPAMHNAAFAELGLDAAYVPFAVRPDRLGDAVKAIAPLGLCGVNVTVPHKEKVLAYLDGLSPEAELIGAVNTIEIKDEKLIGHNTDGRGFLRALKEDAGFAPEGKTFLFIGSGGAARAVGSSLATAGAKKILFRDVDTAKADALARDIRDRAGANVETISGEALIDAAMAADCLINATPLGLKPTDPLPLAEEAVKKKHLVCDLVYNPPETKLLRLASACGARTMSGLGMLLYQGVIAFEIWTGAAAPVSAMKDALTRQLR